MDKLTLQVGASLIWVPSEVEGWEHNDEWSNEFSPILGRVLNASEMEGYRVWSQTVQQGTVSQVGYQVFTIKLLEPAFNSLDSVNYPLDVNLGEYWERVQESPDFQFLPSSDGQAHGLADPGWGDDVRVELTGKELKDE